MAENEMLDPWDKDNSPRWRHLYDRINEGIPKEQLVDEAYRCLVDTVIHLYDLLPMGDLVRTAAQDNREARRLAATCPKGNDYAQLFVNYGRKLSSRKKVVEKVLRAALMTIFDRMELHALNNSEWNGSALMPTDDILIRLSPRLGKLADKIVKDPDEAPRRPSQSAEDKEEERRELVDLSIVTTGRGDD